MTSQARTPFGRSIADGENKSPDGRPIAMSLLNRRDRDLFQWVSIVKIDGEPLLGSGVPEAHPRELPLITIKLRMHS